VEEETQSDAEGATESSVSGRGVRSRRRKRTDRRWRGEKNYLASCLLLFQKNKIITQPHTPYILYTHTHAHTHALDSHAPDATTQKFGDVSL